MKFTWVHVLCLIVVGASAQSFDSGFRLNGFDNPKGRRGNGFVVQTPVIDTSRIRIPNFVGPVIARQTCDCLKVAVRPQTKEIITIPTVQQFFQTPSNAIIQTIPFVDARNFHVAAFPLSSLKMFAEVIRRPVVDNRHRIFSGTVLNIGPSIAGPVCGLNKNFRKILNGVFLGNSLGAAPELAGSFQGTVGAGFNARVSGAVIPRSSVVNGGFANGELGNSC